MRFCLVGITNPCHNPRLVREADALVREGHDTRVVAVNAMDGLKDSDNHLLAGRGWRLDRVDLFPSKWIGEIRSHWMRVRRRLTKQAFRYVHTAKFAEYASCACLPELTALACAKPADWFIAHTQLALPVAAAAAKRWNAHLGVDCEDLLAETGSDSCEAIRLIEERYLPQCEYISAASQAMAERLADQHGVAQPVVLYNVFPTSLADALVPPNARPAHPKLRLHWFSQTLGTDRGLLDVFQACSILAERVEIHLRGHAPGTEAEDILDLAERSGYRGVVKLHSPIPHDQLIMSMGEYDVGLALERPDNPNYSRTVTNKFFSYLLAGLAVAATDTAGQREVMSQIPDAGALYPAENSRALRHMLEHWLADPEDLRRAKQAAWDAARQKFCWDLECAKFLSLLGRGAAPAAALQISVPA